MKETFYFSHDYNARNDPKLQRLLRIHGVAGIGVFWCIIEQVYEQGGQVQLESLCDMAFALHIEQTLIESIVNDFNLFVNDGNVFWSESVNARIKEREEKAKKRSMAGKIGMQKRWNKAKQDEKPDTETPGSDNPQNNNVITTTQQKDNKTITIKGKERKEKESKINNTPNGVEEEKTAKRFCPPTLEEVKIHFEKKGYKSSPERFFSFYESKGWYVGKNKMKNWHAAAAGWESREKEGWQRSTRQENKENEKFSNNEWT